MSTSELVFQCDSTIGLGLWYLTPFSTIFQLYHGGQFYKSWSDDTWIYNYLWNQCLSPLKLWVQIPLMARCTRYNISDTVCQWLPTFQGFSPGTYHRRQLVFATIYLENLTLTTITYSFTYSQVSLLVSLSLSMYWYSNVLGVVVVVIVWFSQSIVLLLVHYVML
jgi:hypothetical protein